LITEKPQPNSLVLDMCAAPGGMRSDLFFPPSNLVVVKFILDQTINLSTGKTLHIATLMKDQGRVFAFDKSKAKVKQIQDLATKHGISCITALHKDSTKLLQISDMHGLGDTNSLHQYFTVGSFDYILLDPPCSGLGSLTITFVCAYKSYF
jgi:16S rRNA C967 or C1407 C5-methylase (RsmB/RsmF family)